MSCVAGHDDDIVHAAIFVGVVVFVVWMICHCGRSLSDVHNSNNNSFWRAQGYTARPAAVGAVHAWYSNANNPNNPIYGSFAEHPNKYVARVFSRCATAACCLLTVSRL